MKVGICLPYAEPELDRQRLVDWCRAVDSGPFSSLSCGERIIGASRDMRVMLAAAAVLTERVRIVPSLYVLPMHDAVRAAKEIASLDILSGGRVTLTVGVGGREDDYRAVGASFSGRHPRLDKQIATMRRVWKGEPGFDGAPEVGPLPVQAGGPPIWTGAMGPLAMARAAHWADGIYAWSGNGQQAEMEALLDRARGAWKKAGRDKPPQPIGGFWFSLAKNSEERLREYVFHYLEVFGEDAARSMAAPMNRNTPEAVADGLDQMEAAGCEEVFLVPATADIEEVERAAEVVARR